MTAADDSHDHAALARAFDDQRGRLTALAQRILDSHAEAEDAVQEAWLRLSRQDPGSIDNLPGWLTTVVGRICIDLLRSRAARPETAYDAWSPEVVVLEDDRPTPEDEALIADSLGVALTAVLDALGPAERLAFVLHDVFAMPFEEIGQVLGRSTDASKMLASRARRKVQGVPRSASDLQRQGRVVDAFLAAARAGDFEGLLQVLDPDVTWQVHTAGEVLVRHGVEEVARKFSRTSRATARRAMVDGRPGLVVWDGKGRPRAAMACTVVGDRIVEMRSITDRARIAAMDLPNGPVTS